MTRETGAGPFRVLRLLFGFRMPVRRLPYVAVGVALAGIKYFSDLAILEAFNVPPLTPLRYLSPFYTLRFAGITDQQALVTLGLWSLPFVWIGATMTYRRALDAGLPGALAGVFFLPGVNYLLFCALSVVPTAAVGVATASPGVLREVAPRARLVLSAAAGGLVGLLIFGIALQLESYGLALFIGGPFAIGFVSAALVGAEPGAGGWRGPTMASQLGVLLAGGALLLFGLEGGICLAMVWPLAAALAFVGSQLGSLRLLATRWGTAHFLVLVTMLPFLMAMDAPRNRASVREVISTIEIDAPPEVVWHHVVSFAQLPEPSSWVLRTGIAYPRFARIDGAGVGAVRHCQFSTGPFVEPITVWDAPHRLSFDVASQPPTMEEWSPLRHIEPAHVSQSLRSERGEFRLIPLPGGMTRLEGSTWYRLEMFPQPYWTLWSDAIIHQIHDRVLRHIRTLSESPAQGPELAGG